MKFLDKEKELIGKARRSLYLRDVWSWELEDLLAIRRDLRELKHEVSVLLYAIRDTIQYIELRLERWPEEVELEEED